MAEEDAAAAALAEAQQQQQQDAAQQGAERRGSRKSLRASLRSVTSGLSAGLRKSSRASMPRAAGDADADAEVDADAKAGDDGEARAARDSEAGSLVEPVARVESNGGVIGFVGDMLARVVGTPSVRIVSRGDSAMVKLNVGGTIFTTSVGTIRGGSSSVLKELVLYEPRQLQLDEDGVPVEDEEDDEPDPRAFDEDGNIFIDHDPKHFGTLLNYMRPNTPASLPEVDSREWHEIRSDAEFFDMHDLLADMDDLEEEQARVAADAQSRNNATTEKLLAMQGRELERMRVELHRLQFEKERAENEGRPIFAKMEYAYNLMVAGVTGSGKSASLNFILNQQVCEVSGSQAQGTRGCHLRDAVLDDKHFVSYLDTQGLGADTSITDEELLEQIMLSAESIRQMGIINNILVSNDLTSRSTPAATANLLTLCELFTSLRRSCFVVFTKWNTNAVLSEWNAPLKRWVKKYRRARSMDRITTDPPSYDELYRAYCNYLLKSLTNRQDGGAFAKVAMFLSFFESRVIWAFNLDAVQVEDMEDGELEPYVQYLYEFYRRKALTALRRGSTIIKTEDLPFLKDEEDTMGDVAQRLVRHRDAKIQQLEHMGMDPNKARSLRTSFQNMFTAAAENMEHRVYDVQNIGSTEILGLIDNPIDPDVALEASTDVCVIQ
ncbi:Immune-associated nucleotide-binding protein 7 [Hondaea fermentalgiana]|uniref:Immune-associated nucleotide-binding protein 7 n=1 Tax=Hondaea fermentalgiana TaxID=2315210 RepID=A0A2R5GIT1_9STRA|nr:Immune-associated nucleotide-binding protein 7 [Hondaea fermentalgiana]|eukprot:GBG30796.1 Immune-associated nucleotide-binding protein 7 [Hondaea fermentalgiana]